MMLKKFLTLNFEVKFYVMLLVANIIKNMYSSIENFSFQGQASNSKPFCAMSE